MDCLADVIRSYAADRTFTIPLLIVLAMFIIIVAWTPAGSSLIGRLLVAFFAYSAYCAIQWGICNEYFGWNARIECAEAHIHQRAALHKMHACIPAKNIWDRLLDAGQH